MKKRFAPAIACALGLLLFSCQTEDSASVNQDRIFTTYELYYDANTDKTTARATFRFGSAVGTNLELSSPAEARFDNDVLSFNSIIGAYEKEYPGFKTQGTFRYTNNDNEVYTNQVGVLKTIAFPANFPTSISRANAFTITWVGDALAAGERVDVVLTRAGSSPLVRVFTQAQPAATAIVLGADQLSQFTAGSFVSVAMYRYRVTDLVQKPEAGGFFSGRHQPADKGLLLD